MFESVIYLFAFVFIFERVFANKRVAWRNTDGRYKKCLGKSRSSHLISSSSIKSSPNINSYVNSTFWVRPKLVCGSTKRPCKKYRLKRTQKTWTVKHELFFKSVCNFFSGPSEQRSKNRTVPLIIFWTAAILIKSKLWKGI